MNFVMDDCKTCENYPCHVSRCVFPEVYCIYFPYDIPNKERTGLKVEKTDVLKGLMNNIDEMWSICHDCPYWEVCDPPFICEVTKQKMKTENG